MTEGELIKLLQLLQTDTKIVIRGYEDGYNDILKLKPVKVKIKSDSKWYEGEYEDNKDSDAINAIDLFGDNMSAED
jgi:hypothetical protein